MIENSVPDKNPPVLSRRHLARGFSGFKGLARPALGVGGIGRIVAAPIFIAMKITALTITALTITALTIAPMISAHAQSETSPARPAKSKEIPFLDDQAPDSDISAAQDVENTTRSPAARGVADRPSWQGGSGFSDGDDPLPPPPAYYQSDTTESVYVVAGLEVSATAADGEQARRAAQASGRAQAMDILLRRLTAEEDWVYLPKLSLGQQADAARELKITGGADITAQGPIDHQDNGIHQDDGILGGGQDQGLPISGFDFSRKEAVILGPADLPALEEGFAVFDEKSSPSTYQAKITYRFKEDDIRAILISAGLPFSDSQSRMALILPILQTDEGLYLWEHNNPWARAWLARPLANELTPLSLPAGDVIDTQMITADQAKALSQDALELFARRYEVAQVIIAQGNLMRKEGQFRLRVRLRDGYLAGRVDPQITATSANSAVLYDDNPEGISANLPLFEAWFTGDEGDFPALARRAVEATIVRYASGWKEQTIVDHSVETPLTLRAYFSDIKEWNLIRDTLTRSPLIARFSTGLLTTSGTTIEIRLLGSISQLVLAMQQRGLVVWSSDDQSWNIASGKTAREVRARTEAVPRARDVGQIDLEARGGRPGLPEDPTRSGVGPARAIQPSASAPLPGSWRKRSTERQDRRKQLNEAGAAVPPISQFTRSSRSDERRIAPQSILPEFAPIEGALPLPPPAIGGAVDSPDTLEDQKKPDYLP